MTDAVTFLRNAMDQAEQWATAASDGEGRWLINPRFADHRTIAEFTIEGERGPVVHIDVQEHDPEAHQAEALLIQANHPAAVLRRIEAERSVLEACDTVLSGWYYGETKELAHDVIAGLARGWGWTGEERHD